jgi:hypothetical protein
MIMQAKIFSKVAAMSLTCIYCGCWYSPVIFQKGWCDLGQAARLGHETSRDGTGRGPHVVSMSATRSVDIEGPLIKSCT